MWFLTPNIALSKVKLECTGFKFIRCPHTLQIKLNWSKMALQYTSLYPKIWYLSLSKNTQNSLYPNIWTKYVRCWHTLCQIMFLVRKHSQTCMPTRGQMDKNTLLFIQTYGQKMFDVGIHYVWMWHTCMPYPNKKKSNYVWIKRSVLYTVIKVYNIKVWYIVHIYIVNFFYNINHILYIDFDKSWLW